MKRLIYIIPIVLIAISSCSSGQHVTSSYNDDIYFDPNDEPKKESASTSSNAVLNKTDSEDFDSLKNGQISDDEYYSDVEGDDGRFDKLGYHVCLFDCAWYRGR